MQAESLDTYSQTRAQASFFIQEIQNDIRNMLPAEQRKEANFRCQINIAQDGRTRIFTFPTRSTSEDNRITQVTYALEQQLRSIPTEVGAREVFLLRRFTDDGHMVPTLGGSAEYIVDFLVEFYPEQEADTVERIRAGACPDKMDKIRIELQVAIPDEDLATNSAKLKIQRYISTTSYNADVQINNQLAVSILAPSYMGD